MWGSEHFWRIHACTAMRKVRQLFKVICWINLCCIEIKTGFFVAGVGLNFVHVFTAEDSFGSEVPSWLHSMLRWWVCRQCQHLHTVSSWLKVIFATIFISGFTSSQQHAQPTSSSHAACRRQEQAQIQSHQRHRRSQVAHLYAKSEAAIRRRQGLLTERIARGASERTEQWKSCATTLRPIPEF